MVGIEISKEVGFGHVTVVMEKDMVLWSVMIPLTCPYCLLFPTIV